MLLRLVSDSHHHLFGSKVLRRYERTCINAWRDQLSEEGKNILDWQLSKYDLVQRMSNDKLVCFYCIWDKTCKSFAPAHLFSLRQAEGPPVASIFLQAEQRKRLKADVVIASGRFFGLEFNISPTKSVERRNLSDLDFRVREIKVWVDPITAFEKTSEALLNIDASLPDDYLATVKMPNVQSISKWKV